MILILISILNGLSLKTIGMLHMGLVILPSACLAKAKEIVRIFSSRFISISPRYFPPRPSALNFCPLPLHGPQMWTTFPEASVPSLDLASRCHGQRAFQPSALLTGIAGHCLIKELSSKAAKEELVTLQLTMLHKPKACCRDFL